jgi:hypothetical protein
MVRLDDLTLSLYPDTTGKCPAAISTLVVNYLLSMCTIGGGLLNSHLVNYLELKGESNPLTRRL